MSRWETGNNTPDLSILVKLADCYDVDIREIINGERKSEKMDDELKDTLKTVAEYSENEKQKLKKKIAEISVSAAILLLFSLIVNATNGFGGNIPERPIQNMSGFATGLALAILVLNALYLSGVFENIFKWKQGLSNKKKKNM